MKVSVSITDLPVFAGMKYLFAGLQQTGADGVELVSGFKSRWRWKKINEYADWYNLPVRTVHQPPWSGLNIYFDEANIRHAVEAGVKTFVFHPLTRCSFSDKKMAGYLERLSGLQKKYGITVALENMPSDRGFRRKFAKQFVPYHPDTADESKFISLLEKYDIGFNLDISHSFYAEPHKKDWFDKLYPRLKNIHLSSFTKERDHLPLYLGDFNSISFLKELKKRQYKGLITLEIFYPKMVMLRNYDFDAIKRSVEIVKSI